MNIAFINYSYPPDTADNGIATYVRQAAEMMASRGHHVEVFAGSTERTETATENGVVVHRMQVRLEIDFAAAIVEKFAERHKEVRFDILEGPDFRAYARLAARHCPDIAYAVKLHTPWVISKEYVTPPPLATRLRVRLGEIRRGMGIFTDFERGNLLKADLLASPSHALGEILVRMWGLDPGNIAYLPNPYKPPADLLAISAATRTETVTFLGRLEIRKGVIELAQAIPLILERHPNAKFRFVGKSCTSPEAGLDMRSYLIGMLGNRIESVEFVEHVPLDEIADVFAKTDVCVIPSRFDNFPGVCLEAMSAARGIVATDSGGMAEMLPTEEFGLLVPPENPSAIAAAVTRLLNNPERRIRMGAAARRRVLAEYSADRVGDKYERFYAEAIERRRRVAHSVDGLIGIRNRKPVEKYEHRVN